VEALEDRTVPTAVAVPSGLVSWWKAQDSAVDLMGLNNATLFNGTTYAAGKVGQAFSFDGVNDRASVGDSASLKLTTSLTIEGWIRVNAFPSSGSGEIFFRGDDTRYPYFLSAESNGMLNFTIVPLTTNGSSLQTPLSLGQLTHVGATLDDATGLMSLYVNGVLAAQTTTDVRPYGDLNAASHPGIGIGNTGGYPGTPYNSPFNGLIDELSVYNRALAPGEVLGIYQAGSDGKVFSPVTVDGPSVVEGSTGTTTPVTFTIQRTDTSNALTVNWATADDSATVGSDYLGASGQVTFGVGEAAKTVPVTVIGDNTGEANETFRLLVTPAGGMTILGVATILNDDSAISISNASATEGDATFRYFDHFIPVQSRLGGPRGQAFGADGNLYVASRFTNEVLKYDGKTGAYLGVVVPSGSFGLHAPWALTFGPDGNLYVGGVLSNNVVRYNMTTGAIDEFLPSSSGVYNPDGLTFDSVGNLYASSGPDSGVLRFQGPGGASPGAPLPAPGQSGAVFVPPNSGGLNGAQGLAFGPDSNLYVGSGNTNTVNRYNGTTGGFIDIFVSAGSGGLNGPGSLSFRPDGFLYVSSANNRAVYRYSATTGAFASTVVPINSGAGALPWDAVGNLYATYTPLTAMQQSIDRYGPASQEAFTVTLDFASALPISVSYATADGTATAGSDYTAVPSGTVFFAPGETSKTILIQTVDDTTKEQTETFTVNLSSPVGATIANGTAVATILDNDSTKFYVVDDASPDLNYRYGVTGNPLGNSTLGSGNSAPRGAAATGTTVWVVDSNKTVYVYNNSGGLLGSWSAGGLNPSAQLEGLASNGTDLWLLDNKQDKVFKYTGAASRLSGSQSAASSFNLNSGNSNAKGIVTDGTFLWVVDDGSTTDKVFKYTLTGSLLGSWTIDAANSSPTGLTLNPNSPSDLWVVDSGTKRVYQYTAAASRTSGSQPAAASFALAATNTNPQDIADPPAQLCVLDDPNPDRTFGYDANGSPAGNSALGSGDTTPRGAAAKADGTVVWVVDAKKKVYVYDPAGGLLGSWTAGGLSASAQLEGIASNGSDLWLLDNKLDTVYRYTGAAIRLSGSQSPASSFGLASGNSNAKGIVTDGTALWVVDDGSTDRVFKYTLNGGLLGSWTIDPANRHPTGLTIDPSNVSDIWVVDSGTRKVYQYRAAASRTSGSQNATATFPLAAGNTNPQDIADPPPPGTRIIPSPLPDQEAAAGWVAEPRSSAMRPVPDGGATPAASRPSLASWLLGELAQTAPIVPPSSSIARQPGVQAAAAPSVGEALSCERPAASTPGPSRLTTEARMPRPRAVDQVFSDPSLQLLDGDLPHRPGASV
jgi:sugar lactone lactonase YvrE